MSHLRPALSTTMTAHTVDPVDAAVRRPFEEPRHALARRLEAIVDLEQLYSLGEPGEPDPT